MHFPQSWKQGQFIAGDSKKSYHIQGGISFTRGSGFTQTSQFSGCLLSNIPSKLFLPRCYEVLKLTPHPHPVASSRAWPQTWAEAQLPREGIGLALARFGSRQI